ncbi:CheR family methyltransferase [Roseicitreum antarcticum]|uniref:histidine kinase n=1 Tax=Roseicitreum antarcticum TaxID=564137 RepID=A0A1H2YTP8_9RHOB|nr:CheR family methyltransferase [Roseicitreum antarcticum]SDX08417.1 two-component system, chemotaxis family, CheB/CheR fusion protein [Roseicitreum antarcticum]
MSPHDTRTALPVIAIGASAGGLDACRAALKDVKATTRAAFILILHLEPTHDSMMVDLLTNHTGLEVVQARDGMALRVGVLHVIPPGVFLTVQRRVLHLSGPDGGQAVRRPFDVLLHALARDAAALSGCIVLSGTGTDGTEGIADIHAAGGLVIAQSPAEAAYPGMPESAIATGFVAQTLPTAGMAAALEVFLAKLPGKPPVQGPAPSQPGPQPTPDLLRPADTASDQTQAKTTGYDALLSFVSKHAAQDITLYKRGTLERRIARRMALGGLGPAEMARYLGILRTDAAELADLTADLLIHVTAFFRDPAVFDHLSRATIPALLADKPTDRPLRVWVAGCSTGEEAYSLAMTAIEAMDVTGTQASVQILASDLDAEAIATARAGFFPREIEAVVSPKRLSRFFVAENGGWRVTSALRDVIVFTVADLLADPPFSRIDLVSCRNLLIYLGPEAQKRVIARCCFALRPGGLLLLGAAETAGQTDDCFTVEDKAARLWRRTGRSHPPDLHFAAARHDEPAPTAPTAAAPGRRSELADLCRKILLDHYAPAAALINARLECVYLLGPTEKYLKVTQGHPDPGVLGMLPKPVRARFRAAVTAATAAPATARAGAAGNRIHGAAGFDIIVHPIPAATGPLVLVCFIDTPRPALSKTTSGPSSGKVPRDLEADLEATRGELAEALRDLEHEVEAHGLDTAEALSVNEEFQSTNEELLASKEELQSLNEELTALNGQLQETLERHRTTANDLQNVLFSTDVATLFLDMDLNIRFFTPAARAIFRLIRSDVGRPLADLASVSTDNDLTADARAVLAASDAKEREVEGTGGLWFLRRIQPYRAEGGRIEGVVITYSDITERRRSNAALETAMADTDRATRAKSRFLAAASHDLRQPLQAMALLHRLLAQQKRSTEGARLAMLMDQTLGSMTAMLDSMLDVNRIESGIVRPEMRPIAIAPLLQRLADEFGPQCSLKGLRLRLVPCTAWVQTDPQLLEQMLRNLLSNAVKYTPKGGILLGCRRHGQDMTIHVCDTGIGVPESESTAIFNAYQQGANTSKLGGMGLGLGLSIVERLAQLMSHPIAVRSTLGKGSAFMVTLPVVEATPQILRLTKTAAALKGSERPTGTVLLVDDEEPLRALLAEVLTKEGHTVVARSNTKDALLWASGDVDPPDILLTDFDLHGGASGLTLAQDLPDVLGRAVPTIILTGDITSATFKKIAGSAFTQVIKPVMPEVLLAQISELILQARAAKTRRRIARTDATVTTVHVIDDDPIIRETVRRLFEAEGWIVVSYASAEEFLAAPRPGIGECLLVDNVLPGIDGVALIRQLRAEKSHIPAVVLTGHGDAAIAVAAMRAGASDLIEKPVAAADLLHSMRQAIAPGQDARAGADRRRAAQKRFATLTAREREVLTRVLAGDPNKIIAADLGINQRTVENHRASVMHKTGAASLPALVRLELAANPTSV